MILTRKHLAAVLVIIGAICVFTGINKHETRQTMANNNIKIIVDAGHGEPDGGAVGVSGVLEKDVNLAIAQKLAEVLEARGASVIMTRDSDNAIYDEDAKTIREMKRSDMNNRRAIVKKSGADLFVSIHMNSFSDSNVHGLHVFYDKTHPEIEETAKKMQQHISEVTGADMHTVKTADEKLFLMKNPPVPSILVECGFLSNPEEEQKLISDEYQAKIAWAIASSLSDYTH